MHINTEEQKNWPQLFALLCKRGCTFPSSLAQWVLEGEKASTLPRHNSRASLSPSAAVAPFELLTLLWDGCRQCLDGQQVLLLSVVLEPTCSTLIAGKLISFYSFPFLPGESSQEIILKPTKCKINKKELNCIKKVFSISKGEIW